MERDERPGSDDDPGRILGAIFSASPDAIVVVDSDGVILLSNPAVESLFGYFPEELVGASLSTLIPTDRREVHRRHLAGFFVAPHARQMGAGLQLAGRHRSGAEFSVDVSLAPVELRGRLYAAAFVRNATEQQRAIQRLHAVNEITQQLLSGSDVPGVLPVVAAEARRLNRSDAAWIVLPRGDGQMEIVAADGEGSAALLGEVLAAESSRSASVMRTGECDVIDDLSTAPNVPPQCAALDLGPGLYSPLVSQDRRLGALVYGRVHGAPEFTPLDVAFAEVFASAITAAVELGDARLEIEKLGIAAEDERIARDLHDTVIQQLFAIGMSLQAARSMAPGVVGERIESAVDRLDDVIKEIRNTIFRLPSPADPVASVRGDLLDVADSYRAELGFPPRVAFDGPVDVAVPEAAVEQLLHVVREGVSNVVRHASASSLDIVLSVGDGRLTLSIADDGVGIAGGPTAGNGLRNMARRAEQLGGHFEARPRPPRGTVVEWSVPI